MKLSIICVNWNSVDYLRECIASIYEHTRDLSFEIIVVDSASPQGGVDALKVSFPDITIIKCETNVGFAAANNVGFRKSSGEYILFLNPDTKLVGPAINGMLERVKDLENPGIVGCRLLNADNSVQLTSIQKFPTILNQFLDLEYFQVRWPACSLWDIAPLFASDVKVAEVEVISGACMLVPRGAFEKIGLFTEDYFMYAEDIDLNYKARRAGFRNYYIGDATIVHYGGKSSSRQEVSYWATLMKYRAMKKLFENTKGGLYAFLYRTSMGVSAVGRLMILAAAYPLGNLLGKKSAVRAAMRKWKVILQWALGLHSMAFGD